MWSEGYSSNDLILIDVIMYTQKEIIQSWTLGKDNQTDISLCTFFLMQTISSDIIHLETAANTGQCALSKYLFCNKSLQLQSV